MILVTSGHLMIVKFLRMCMWVDWPKQYYKTFKNVIIYYQNNASLRIMNSSTYLTLIWSRFRLYNLEQQRNRWYKISYNRIYGIYTNDSLPKVQQSRR